MQAPVHYMTDALRAAQDNDAVRGTQRARQRQRQAQAQHGQRLGQALMKAGPLRHDEPVIAA